MTNKDIQNEIRTSNFIASVRQDIREGRIKLAKGDKLIIGQTSYSCYSCGWTSHKQVLVAGCWKTQKSGREVFEILDSRKILQGKITNEVLDKKLLLNPTFALGTKTYQF